MPPCLPEYCGGVPALTPVQWLSPGEPPLAYLAWRLLAAAIALAGLLQSIVQNTLEFIEKEQEENIDGGKRDRDDEPAAVPVPEDDEGDVDLVRGLEEMTPAEREEETAKRRRMMVPTIIVVELYNRYELDNHTIQK